MLILYKFSQTQKYFTLALLVLLVTNIMSVENIGHFNLGEAGSL